MYIPKRWLFPILLGGSFATIHMAALWWLAALGVFLNRFFLGAMETEWQVLVEWDAYWSWEPWFNAVALHGTGLALLVGWYGFGRTVWRKARGKPGRVERKAKVVKERRR